MRVERAARAGVVHAVAALRSYMTRTLRFVFQSPLCFSPALSTKQSHQALLLSFKTFLRFYN